MIHCGYSMWPGTIQSKFNSRLTSNSGIGFILNIIYLQQHRLRTSKPTLVAIKYFFEFGHKIGNSLLVAWLWIELKETEWNEF